MERHMPDYTKSAKERFVEALNKANPESLIPFQVSNIIFGLPTPVAGSNGNTKITLQPLSLNGLIPFEGKRTAFYNRLDLATFFSLLTQENLVVSNVITAHDLLPLIYEQFRVKIEPFEIIDEPILDNVYTIRATPSAIGWTGEVTFAAGIEPPPPIANGFMLDDGSLFSLDDGSIFYLDDMIVVLES